MSLGEISFDTTLEPLSDNISDYACQCEYNCDPDVCQKCPVKKECEFLTNKKSKRKYSFISK